MLKVKVMAELRQINVRARALKDELIPTIDVKLMLLDAPLENLTTLLPDWKQFYNGENLVLQEIIPFPIHHRVENVELEIGGFTLKACMIKKMSRMWPKPGKNANVFLTVQCDDYPDDVLKYLSHNQKETIEIAITENQGEMLSQAAG